MDLLMESLTLSVVAGGSKSSQAGYLYIYFTTTDTTDTTNTAEIINSDSLKTPPDSL